MIFGFTTPDDDFSWTNLPKAALQFRSARPATQDVEIAFTAEPFLYAGCTDQPMNLVVNGHPVASFKLTTRETVRARIPLAVWNERPLITIVLELPGARSPRHLGYSTDPRQLAWGISEIAFRAAP